ncbi:MAG TPA: nitronate monooxygenase [Rhizobacter sp.]|nr:nitronate monooxygenase [Rhizobacter sp.]
MNTPIRLHTPLTEALQTTQPVLLAAMDLVADARLVRAVTEAGGYGFLGGGYGDEAWLKRELAALLPWSQETGRRFGIGFITWSLARQPQLLDLALDARPSAVWLSFGDVSPFTERIKASGARLVCQVQTEAMARAALDHGADMLVAQGSEAGGHGVSRGTLALVPALVDMAGPSVPVVAAGGIADGRGLAAALMLGAAGVALGTRLYATQEAAGFDAAKQRIVAASGDDSLRGIVFDLSRKNVWPAPYTGRCLLNEHLRRWSGHELELLRDQSQVAERYAEARAKGDFDIAAVIAGESAGLVHDVPSVAQLIDRLIADAASRLRAAPAFIA